MSYSQYRGARISFEPIIVPVDKADDVRCWICLGDYKESPLELWVRPCPCRGSIAYSHEECLLRYIRSRPRRNQITRCPHCTYPYSIFSTVTTMYRVLMLFDRLYTRSMKYLFLATLGAGFFTAAASYGALVTTVCAGPTAVMDLCVRSAKISGWPRALIAAALGLPYIPSALLILTCGVRSFSLSAVPLALLAILQPDLPKLGWPPEGSLLATSLPWMFIAYDATRIKIEYFLLRSQLRRLRVAAHPGTQAISAATNAANHNTEETSGEVVVVARAEGEEEQEENQEEQEVRRDVSEYSRKTNFSRTLVGALSLPLFASSVGWLIGKSNIGQQLFPNTFLRSVVGGALFMLVRDTFSIYYNLENLQHELDARVANYVE